MAASRSSSDTHLSEKANEVSANPFNIFTFQLALYTSLLFIGCKMQFISSGNRFTLVLISLM
jgi:hypothetical protein